MLVSLSTWHLDLYELKVIMERGLENSVRIDYTE